jgi:carboxyl-terminal processing protease
MYRTAIAVGLLLAASTAQGIPSPRAHAYLDHALSLMEEHALHRATLDFAVIRARAFADAEHAHTTQQTWPAIRTALSSLGDGHSALLTPEQGPRPASFEAVGHAPQARTMPTGAMLDDALAYLWVPGHAGGDRDADAAFADALQTLIFKLADQQPCGWIVDLRDNPGGNMWPMFAGLEPLIGDGRVGAFKPPSGAATHWWVDDGTAGSGGDTQAVSRFAVTVDGPLPIVAVLTGPMTASSGEAVAVAFRGRRDARSFGAPTLGVSTGNRGFRLEDGAVMFVTASRFADRDGRVYGGKVVPDQPVAASRALPAAATWLQAQARCRTMRR